MNIKLAKPNVILARIIFYLFQGFIVALCYYIIPNASVVHYSFDNIIFIGIVATIVIICIDRIIPELGIYMRYGLGLVISSITNL